MSEVVCLGILVADIVGKPVDVYPGRGELTWIDTLELHTGGCAANTGVSLSKIGIETALIGKVGNDGFGDFMISALKKQSIDTNGVVQDMNAHTSGTMIMVHSDGERDFIHYIGANARITPSDIDFELVAKSKILHLAGTFLMPGFDGIPAAEVLKKAKSLGVTITWDSAWDASGRWMSIVEPMLPYIDIAVPSMEEAKRITQKETPHDVAGVLMDYGIKIVGLKMGEAGCYIRSADTEISIPVYDINPVDATGAGDAFAAGFLTGILKGWDLEKTGRFANAVGALCVTAIGAITGIKSLEETLKFMETTGVKS